MVLLVCDDFRPEAVSDIMSDKAAEYAGMSLFVNFGDSRLNRFRDIRAAHFVMDDRRQRTQVVT